jgi:hypothetical protein
VAARDLRHAQANQWHESNIGRSCDPSTVRIRWSSGPSREAERSGDLSPLA